MEGTAAKKKQEDSPMSSSQQKIDDKSDAGETGQGSSAGQRSHELANDEKTSSTQDKPKEASPSSSNGAGVSEGKHSKTTKNQRKRERKKRRKKELEEEKLKEVEAFAENTEIGYLESGNQELGGMNTTHQLGNSYDHQVQVSDTIPSRLESTFSEGCSNLKNANNAASESGGTGDAPKAGFFNWAKDKVFGLSKLKGEKESTAIRQHHFYVSVQEPAFKVQITFVKGNYTQIYAMQPEDASGLYWKLAVDQVPKHLANCPFYYQLQNRRGGFNNFAYLKDYHSRRKDNRSSYTVFCFDKPYFNDYFTGPFHFAQSIFQDFLDKKMTLAQSLQEYDEIRFGRTNMKTEDRMKVAQWIRCELEKNSTCENAIFFAHVIQEFDNRLLYKISTNHPLIKDCIGDQVKQHLLYLLSQCENNKIQSLGGRIEKNVKGMVSFIMCNLNGSFLIENLVNLCCQFGVNILSFVHEELKMLHGNESITLEALQKACARLSTLEPEKDRNRLITFIVKRSPSISFLWTFHKYLNDVFPNCLPSVKGLLPKNFIKLLTQNNARPAVLDESSWKSVPESFRQDLSTTFMNTLRETLKHLGRRLDISETNALKIYFTDEALMKQGNGLQVFSEVCKVPEMSKVAIEVLKLPGFAKFWGDVPDKEKTEIYEGVVGHFLSLNSKREDIENKGLVLRIFETMNDIYLALKVCPCESIKQEVRKNCDAILTTEELLSIAHPFSEIKQLQGEVVDYYVEMLRNTVDREIANSQRHSNILKLLEGLSNDDVKQRQKVAWVTENILLSLCEQTKGLDGADVLKQYGVQKVLEGVFANEKLWSALLRAWPKGQEFKFCLQLEVLTMAVKLLKESLDEETIKIKDLRTLRENPQHVNLLQLVHTLLVEGIAKVHEGPEQIVNLVSICSKGETESYQTLEQLVDSLAFLKKITKKIVSMTDMDDVLKDLTRKKDTFEEMMLCDVSGEDFLGSVAPYRERVLKMKYLKEYKVFQNAAKVCLREKYPDLRKMDVGVPLMPFGNEIIQSHRSCIRDVVQVVINGGVSHLKEKCIYLVTDAGKMPVKEAKEVLQGVKEGQLKEELKFIQRIFKSQQIKFDAELLLERFLRFPKTLSNVKVLQKLLDSRKLQLSDIEDFSKKSRDFYKNLRELHQATETVAFLEHIFEGNYGEVIEQVSESEELIKLLEETADDDVSHLIDAVEEHSDSTVAAKEVSDFIEIHLILAPVLKAEPRNFLSVLQRRLHMLSDEQANEFAARIKYNSQNVHSLRNLYKNVANRGEITKEVVYEAVTNGRYEIKSKQEKHIDGNLLSSEELWEYCLSYTSSEAEEKENITQHDMEKLQDLKSRALLIVNTERKQQRETDENANFQLFIKQIDVLNEIIAAGEELQKSGHPKYQEYCIKCNTLEEMQNICKELKEEVQTWEMIVRTARGSNFFLNFFHTRQLWVLKELFNISNPTCNEEAFSLLRFVDKSVTMEQVEAFQNRCNLIPESSYPRQLQLIGSHLETFFRSISRQHTEIHSERGLVVSVLDQGNTRTTSVVMKLFQHCSSPQPNRIMFCHNSSTWYEIELFLWRTFTDSRNGNSPYCLANVDNLPTDLQFQLIDSIRKFQQSSMTNYWLVLICRGGEHHHIVNQFRDCVKDIKIMTDYELQSSFGSSLPEVTTVTSDLPGLGKTERIHRRAAEKGKRIVCFSINGPVSHEKLVHRLSNLGLDEECLLHIDISEVDDPLLVDNFVFELIVFGMASSGTKLYHLPTNHIAIEIANTLQHRLKDSLPTTNCYPHIHLEWQGFQDFVCSRENGSPMQVVCQYLNVYSKQSLETEKLSVKDLKQSAALSESKCRDLIARHFASSSDLSFNVVHNFLNVLATQLRKFSSSPFFRPENLKGAMKDSSQVRVRLFEALKDVSIDFATRSVAACKEEQQLTLFGKLYRPKTFSFQQDKEANELVDRVKGMIKWTDENHLVVMFQEAFSVSALFRQLDRVPDQVKALFESQNDPLRDLGGLNEQELKEKLKKILFADTRNQSQDFDSHSYVLTPDNILKMVLIIQRIRAGVPVIIMGETGCGKTSLVRYLASSCGVPLAVLNFHAGIYEKDIVKFTQEQIETAEKDMEKQVWVFFDEINTCDYLGLINDIVCHKSLNGRELPPNLVFIAACNPYCLRPAESIMTSGLTEKSLTDEYSNLVYRVKPLPETMMDYVWDYGSLDPKDERAYIKRMVDKLERNDSDLLVDLLGASQDFIRQVEKNPYCVSLRDVRRCILLAKWFMKMIGDRPDLDVTKFTSQKVKEIYEKAQGYDVEKRSIVLALAHSYQCRIPSSDKRKEYRLKLESVYKKHYQKFTAADLDLIIRAEQEEYLARMELPEGTARNTALRENVFVILVCILNKIPVFVVGKPGNSKSLSMQVIRSNLRGKDSKDRFFRTLPQLRVISYQGSESSTSEGILKSFEKARTLLKEGEIIPVLLLDEVGLAEISKYNPLKVLHRLLEPGGQEFPDVAVVGISNWALDAAKMNRAIHLSRPEPTLEDLKETGLAIREAQLDIKGEDQDSQETVPQGISEELLSCLAQTYFDYQKVQSLKNFHGLRDYYSLVKCLNRSLITANENTTSVDQSQKCNTFHALQRNFGGLLNKDQTIEDIFCQNSQSLQSEGISETREEFPVTDLVCDNLEDLSARHLMLITRGDSALSIIDQTLSDMKKEKVIICGSRFEEDISEDYSYRILSRIILHMERDCVLVLRDLESVYGSLYDMLNQNYVVMGEKKICRVALGPYSNPMCQVHDGFRCIVLIDEDKVTSADPPFLNRFEKQLLRYSDVLTKNEQNVITKLKRWTKDFCRIEKADFSERDVFLGFDDDTLASLVLLKRDANSTKSDHSLLEMCKDELISIATPDGVLRSLRSDLYKHDALDVKHFYERFFKKPIHTGLKGFIESFLDRSAQNQQAGSTCDPPNMSFKYFVMTHSSIHTDVTACLKGSVTCQVEKLGAFKSEKHLTKRIQTFWSDSDKELLIFQCKPNLDGEHMTLMKSMIEQHHESFLRACVEQHRIPTKSICVIVHLQRGNPSTDSHQWHFSFLRGWKQATLDALEEPHVPVNKLLGESVFKLFQMKTLSLESIIKDRLWWCFTRLKYPQNLSDPERINKEVCSLCKSEPMMKYLHDVVLQCIHRHHDKIEEFWSSKLRACDWQIKVSCDKKALFGSLTLSGAILRYIDDLVRKPLAKAIYLIANRLTFENCQRALTESSERTENDVLVAALIKDEELFNIDEIPDPQESGCYVLNQAAYSLEFPFSIIFCEKIGSLKVKYLKKWKDDERNLSTNDERKEEFFQELSSEIKQVVPHLFRYEPNEGFGYYIEDVFDFKSSQYASALSRKSRVAILKAACARHLVSSMHPDLAGLLAKVHFFLWMHESDFLAVQQLCSLNLSLFDKVAEKLSSSYIDVFDRYISMTKRKKIAGDGESDEEDEEDGDDNDDEEDDDDDDDDDEDDDDDDDYDDEEDDNDDGDDEDDDYDDDDDDDDGSVKVVEDVVESYTSVLQQKEIADFLKIRPFLEIMFETLSEALIPSQKLIHELGSPQNWLTTANAFVIHAAKSNFGKSKLFNNLRVCCDFASMILSPSSFQNPFSLYMLGELCRKEKTSTDLHHSFDKILDVIEKMDCSSKMANDFKVNFLGRCLDSCETEEAYNSILQRLAISITKKEDLEVASPLIYRIIFYARLFQKESPFLDILKESTNYPFFNEVDRILDIVVKKENGTQDCHFAVICLDVIEQMTCRDLDFCSVSEVSASSSRTMTSLRTALAIAKEPTRLRSSLKILIAISYIRNSLSSIAELIYRKPILLKRESEYSNLFKFLSSFLESPEGRSTESPRKASLMLYFLRELRKNLSLHELRKLCEEAHMLPALKSLKWTDDMSKFPTTTSLLNATTRLEFQIALVNLMHLGDASGMEDLCRELGINAMKRREFARALTEELYLPQSLKVQTDTMDKATDSIIALLPLSLSPTYRKLILCLTGKEDFKGKELRMSPEMSLSAVKKTTVILHLLSILTAECNLLSTIDRPFLSYLLDPTKALGGYLLANADCENQKLTETETELVLTCACGIAFLNQNFQTNCPQCQQPCVSKPPSITNIRIFLPTGRQPSCVLLCIEGITEDEFCVKDMTPSGFRFLHILVFATLYAGISLGTLSVRKLAQIFGIEEDNEDPVEKCLKEINSDLRVLQRLWGCNEERVISIVHQLIDATSGLITKRIGGPSLSFEQREDLQKSFTGKVNQFFQNRKDDHKNEYTANPSSLEAQIDEKDDLTVDLDVEMRNSWLPRLFRYTKQKSLNDLRVSYYTVSDSVKKRHPLLGLFLHYMNILPEIGHLYPLIKFPTMLENHFGRRLSRKDAKKEVGNVIKGHPLHEDLENAMKEFISSWENVRSTVENELGAVPKLTGKTPISYFLMEPDSSETYLYKAVEKLQRIQNEFQGKVLKFAIEGCCPALSFLKKSDSSSSMPVIHVQDVKRSELICFEWDDNILLHSYHDTEYGKGHEIHYDFGKIESELAERFLIGKVYLSIDGGLREFPYRNELFHTCANVLNDISARLPQRPISADQQNLLSVLKDEELKSVQDLLDNLEVIICFLSKTSYFEPSEAEKTLTEYVKRKLPNSNLLEEQEFGVHLKEAKLCHVVSIYQKLEELLGDVAIEAVHDKYREPVETRVLQRLEGFRSSKENEMEVVVTTLRRFIFRYLLSDQEHQDTRDPQENAFKYFSSDPSLWSIPEAMSVKVGPHEDEPKPVFQDLMEKFIPSSMRICEVYSVMSFYDKTIREAKEKSQKQMQPLKTSKGKIKSKKIKLLSGYA